MEDYKKLIYKTTNCNANHCLIKKEKVYRGTSPELRKFVLFSMGDFNTGASGMRTHNIVRLLGLQEYIYTIIYMFSDKKIGTVLDSSKKQVFYSLGNPAVTKNIFLKVKKNYFFLGKIKKILVKEKPTDIFIYSVLPIRIIKYIKKYCQKNHIKLYFDVVEYRSSQDTISLKQEITYNRSNRFVSEKAIDCSISGVSCPTHYLEKYFVEKRKAKNVLVFPITTKIDSLPKYNKIDELKRITFLYAGTPDNRRDLLANIIQAFTLLSQKHQDRCLLIVCGISPEKLIENEGLKKDVYESSLKFSLYLGRISKNELYSFYHNIDFTLLLKDPNRQFSKAGFPTKMSESFSIGIPMITNLSGDIGHFLVDGYNGYLSEDYDPISFSKQLKRAIEEYDQKHNEMVKNALQTAYESFDVDNYSLAFDNFLKN